MLGTGECASSASESTSPSCTSSSWRSGTYWRHIGSPGDLIRSTMAGAIRNSKFSAACRRRSRSGKCSAPNLATSASSDARLRLRSSSCQDSMPQVLEVDHQVVAGRVVRRDCRDPAVSTPLVERARRGVVLTRRRLHDYQPAAVSPQSLLHCVQQLGPHAPVLPRGIHHQPVQVRRADRAGRRAPAGVADQLVTVVRAEEAVVVVPLQARGQQPHGGGHFLRPKHAGGRRQPLKPCALRATEDRKSTRLNSSHLVISYAVFCLKKKKTSLRKNVIADTADSDVIIRQSLAGDLVHQVVDRIS